MEDGYADRIVIVPAVGVRPCRPPRSTPSRRDCIPIRSRCSDRTRSAAASPFAPSGPTPAAIEGFERIHPEGRLRKDRPEGHARGLRLSVARDVGRRLDRPRSTIRTATGRSSPTSICTCSTKARTIALVRNARRAHHHARHPHRRALCGVGAQRAPGQRRRRLQQLGRPRAPDARDSAGGLLGDFPPRPGRRRSLQVRSARRRRPARAEGRPLRTLFRDAAADGVDRLERRQLRLAGRRVDDGAAGGGAVAAQADVDLRSASGQLAAPRRWPPAHLSRDGGDASCRTCRTWDSRTSSCCR